MLQLKKVFESEEYSLKKIASIILVICIALSSVSVFAFDDMPDDWSTTALKHAVANGLLSGYDNKLMPKDKLTRAQMATILVRALGATELGDISSFTDVKKDAWYHDAMAISYKMGIFRGDGAGKLNPDSPITRQEAFVVLSRAFSLSASTTSGISKFKDGGEVAAWAKEGIEALIVSGYVAGSNGKINPNSHITRAEFAQVMYNLVKTYANKVEDIPTNGEIHGNVIVRGSDVSKLKGITINGDLIIGEGVSSKLSLTDVIVNGRIVIRAKGNFSFDGEAKELILTSENSDILISADSTVAKVTIVSSTSSYEVLSGTGTTPSKPVSPKPVNPDPEEDIWTNFQ